MNDELMDMSEQDIENFFDSLAIEGIQPGLPDNNYIERLCIMLNALGYNIGNNNKNTRSYDTDVSAAVQRFQIEELHILSPSRSCTKSVYLEIFKSYLKTTTIDSDTNDEQTEDSHIPNPHYDSFFDNTRDKMHRRNHKDIRIVFGNSTITKRIVDVFMRSVSVEVDTSGNPISEIYEFVARDIVESDESTDANNYDGLIAPGKSSSDIKYIFNLGSYSSSNE